MQVLEAQRLGNEASNLSDMIRHMTADEQGTVNNPIIDIATDADESAENGEYNMNTMLN